MTTEKKVDEFDQEDLERESLLKESFTFSGKLPDVVNTEQEIFLEQFGEVPQSQSAEEQIEQYGWDSKLQTSVLIEKAKEGDQKAKHILKMREFRRKFAIINYSGKTSVFSKNTKGEMLFQDFKSFKEYHMNEWYEWEVEDIKKNLVTKRFYVADAFLRDKNVIKYEGIEFYPGKSNPNYLNLWKGWKVKPVRGNVDMFLELIRSLSNFDEPATEYLLNYLAHLYQKPEVKPEVALVLRSKSHGVGKGTLLKLLGRTTDNYMHMTSNQSLSSQFSGHLADKILIFLDESTWAPGDHSISGRIKGLISEPVIEIRAMRQDSVQIRSFLRIIIASNEDFPVAIEGEDRRFFVLDCSAKYKGQTNPGEFFFEFNKWIENGGDEAVMFYLLNRDISQFNPRVFPKTNARLEIQMLSLQPAQKFIYELLCGTGPIADETMTIEGKIRKFKRNSLYADMVDWCKTHNRGFSPSTDQFGKTMSKIFQFEKQNEKWKTSWCKKVNNKNEYYYQFNSMVEAQELFAKNVLDSKPEDVFFNHEQLKEEGK